MAVNKESNLKVHVLRKGDKKKKEGEKIRRESKGKKEKKDVEIGDQINSKEWAEKGEEKTDIRSEKKIEKFTG